MDNVRAMVVVLLVALLVGSCCVSPSVLCAERGDDCGFVSDGGPAVHTCNCERWIWESE